MLVKYHCKLITNTSGGQQLNPLYFLHILMYPLLHVYMEFEGVKEIVSAQLVLLVKLAITLQGCQSAGMLFKT